MAPEVTQPIPSQSFWTVLHAFPFQADGGEDDPDSDWYCYCSTWHETEADAVVAAEQAEGDAAAVYAHLGTQGRVLWAVFDLVHGGVGEHYMIYFRTMAHYASWLDIQSELTCYTKPIPVSFGLGAPPIDHAHRRSSKSTARS